MANFKVGQKVVCIESVATIKEGSIYTVREIVPLSQVGKNKCTTCGNSNSFVRLKEDILYGYCFCVLRPLSYSSNTNWEVIANFSPIEERSDVPVKEKETINN